MSAAVESVRKLFDERGIRRVKLGAFDIDATLRGKYISLDKFWSAVESGMGAGRRMEGEVIVVEVLVHQAVPPAGGGLLFRWC